MAERVLLVSSPDVSLHELKFSYPMKYMSHFYYTYFSTTKYHKQYKVDSDCKELTILQFTELTLISFLSSGLKSPFISTIKGEKVQSYSESKRRNLLTKSICKWKRNMSNETIDGTEAEAYRLKKKNRKYTLNPTKYKFSRLEVKVALRTEH